MTQFLCGWLQSISERTVFQYKLESNTFSLPDAYRKILIGEIKRNKPQLILK